MFEHMTQWHFFLFKILFLTNLLSVLALNSFPL